MSSLSRNGGQENFIGLAFCNKRSSGDATYIGQKNKVISFILFETATTLSMAFSIHATCAELCLANVFGLHVYIVVYFCHFLVLVAREGKGKVLDHAKGFCMKALPS